jgi:hypothetical protein
MASWNTAIANVNAGVISLDRRTTGDMADALPPKAAEKLRSLRQAAEDADVLARAGQEAWAEALSTKNDAANHIARIEESYGPGGRSLPPNRLAEDNYHKVPDDVPTVYELADGKLKVATSALTRATDLRDLRNAHAAALRATVQRLETYIASAGRLAESPALDVALKRAETAATAIERTRDTLATLRADLHTVSSAPVHSSVVKARALAELAELAERGCPDFFEAVESDGPIRWPTTRARAEIEASALGRDGSAAPVIGVIETPVFDARAFTAWAMLDMIAAKLDAAIDQVADDESALDAPTRRKRVEEIRAEILEAERVEERLIELAAVNGTTIARRNDADPRAILGVEGPAPRAE